MLLKDETADCVKMEDAFTLLVNLSDEIVNPNLSIENWLPTISILKKILKYRKYQEDNNIEVEDLDRIDFVEKGMIKIFHTIGMTITSFSQLNYLLQGK